MIPSAFVSIVNEEVLLTPSPAECSTLFEYCTGITTSIEFEHAASLDNEEVRFQLYGLADEIANHVASSLKRNMSYVGLSSVSATFKMEIAGVPLDTLMSVEQKQYFRHFSLWFITNFDESVDVLTMHINDQIPLNQRALQNGPTSPTSSSIEINGEIRGLQFYYIEDKEFAEKIQSTLQEREQAFVERLTFDAILPKNDIAEEDSLYFVGITSVASELQPIARAYNPPPFWNTAAPTPTPPAKEDDLDVADETGKVVDSVLDEASNVDKNTWMLVGAIVAVTIALIGLGLFLCRLRSKRRMRHKSQNKEKDAGAERETRSAPPDNTREADTTIGEEGISRADKESSQQPVASVRRSESFDSVHSTLSTSHHSANSPDNSYDSTGTTRPTGLSRSMSEEGAQLGPKRAPPKRVHSHDGIVRSTVGAAPAEPIRRGRKPERSISSNDVPARPPRSHSSDGMPTRVAPQRSYSSDGMPARGPHQRMPSSSRRTPQQGPSARAPLQRAASESIPRRPPPIRNPSSQGLSRPTRLPSGTLQGVTPQSRLPTTARDPPQLDESANLPIGQPAPQGLRRIPSVRAPTQELHHTPATRAPPSREPSSSCSTSSD